MHKHIDRGSLTVAVITLGLFVAALFSKGLTHDLFLEAGLFLVSVKIIMMAYHNSVAIGRLDEKLDVLLAALTGKAGTGNAQGGDPTGGHAIIERTAQRWQRAIIADAEKKVGRTLTENERLFITSRGGFLALEMIHDTVRTGTREEIVSYLNSEPGPVHDT